jgi:hypothetical protein
VKKLLMVSLGLSFLGLLGLSLAANPSGKTNPAQKEVPARKSIPSEKSLPAAERAGDPSDGQSAENRYQENFKTSLHHTGRGLAFWYGKEQKGLELLTGQPYENLACKQCHVGSCQGCHQAVKKEKAQAGKPGPVDESTCLKCHDRLAALRHQMREAKKDDVHSALGLTCLDCHSSREMHGDGKIYQSQKEPGAMDARCDRCHEEIPDSFAHRKHGKKVSCQACHAHTVLNRTSTQFELLAREGKRVSVPETGWIFLMSREKKLTAAALETWVFSDGRTLMVFAPDGSHAIGKTGRKCWECHGSPWMIQAQKGTMNLSWMEKGEVKKGRGIIPVLEGPTYNLIQQRFQNGKWARLEPSSPSPVQYAAYGGPVSDKHFRKMLKFKSEEPEPRDKKKRK